MYSNNTRLKKIVLTGSFVIASTVFVMPELCAKKAPAPQAQTLEQLAIQINKNNPALSQELATCLNLFEKIIHSFLSNENKEPYAIHVQRIELAVRKFQLLSRRYTCPEAKVLAASLEDLLNTLKKHLIPKKSLPLGMELIKHNHLLPKSVTLGPIALLSQLSFRLSC